MKIKKIICLLLFAAMLAALLSFGASAANVSEKEPNNTTSTALKIKANDVVTGTLTDPDTDIFLLELSAAGRLSLSIKTASQIVVSLYDDTGYFEKDAVSGLSSYSRNFDLPAGKYYIELKFLLKATSYTLTPKFTTVAVTYSSTAATSLAAPRKISSSASVTGLMSAKKSSDVYKLTMTYAGRLNISLTAYDGLKWMYFNLYDKNGKLVHEINHFLSSGKTGVATKYYADVEMGNYYLAAIKDSGYTGKYAFTLSAAYTGLNDTEPNNIMSQAKSSAFGKAANGILVKDDAADYFKISVPATGNYTLNLTSAQMDNVHMTVYFPSGVKKQAIPFSRKTLDKRLSETEEIYFSSAGTYYFAVRPLLDETGRYQFTLAKKAATPPKPATQKYASIRINYTKAIVGGKKQTIDSNKTKPIIRSGKTYVPLRFISNGLGAKVSYTSNSKPVVVSYGTTSIEFKINSKNVTVTKNGVTSAKTMAASAILVGGRMLIPIRAVSENLGFGVSYNSATGIVIVTNPALSKTSADSKYLAEAKGYIK